MWKRLATAAALAAASITASVPAAAGIDFSLHVAHPAPRGGYAWVPGQWEWRHGQRVFVPGHWTRDPRFVPHANDGWAQRYGRLHHDRGQFHGAPHDGHRYRGHGRDFDRDGIPDRFDRDRDNDGVRNRFDRDRDGDGVRNRFDIAPDNPYRR